jgi:exonuclease VII large subunit
LTEQGDAIERLQTKLVDGYAWQLFSAEEKIERCATGFLAHDPSRLLRLGYSLAMKDGFVVRRIDQVRSGDMLEVRLTDGSIRVKVL